MINKIEKIINSCGASLYDTETVVENNKKIFRVYITCKNGIKLEKCEEISKILSPIFDLEPPVSGQYFLEISSPGIERALKEPKHFIYSIGESVKVKLQNGDKLTGKITEASDVDFTIKEAKNEDIRKISYENITKVTTYFEWN